MRLPRRLAEGDTAELVDHLGELRARVIVSLVAVAAGFAVAFVFRERLIELLNAPLPADHKKPVTLGVTEPFVTSLKISAFAGLAIALPVVLWQFWSFVAPALDRGIRRAIAALVAFGAALFAAGTAFGYFVALPAAVRFLTDYDSNLYDIEVRASYYYSFVLAVIGSVGIVFELPVIVLGLVRLGVLSSDKLRRNRRTGYVGMAVLAVVLPGVDPVTTALLMAPLMGLFEASIWLSVALERRLEPEGQPA